MISALLYLQINTTRNRLVARIKRLRQPKYLFGGIVGALYFYWYFFRPFLHSPRGGQTASFGLLGLTPELVESVAALVLLVIVLLSWFFPSQRTALTFSEAEIAFLFPAPVSRTSLIHFKLLRSQFAILFTTLLLTLFSRRLGGYGWIHAAGWWVLLSTLNLHFLGGSFVRTALMDRGITPWKRRLRILGLTVVFAALVGGWIWKKLPPIAEGQFDGFESIREYFLLAANSGPLAFVLYPFRVLARPFLAVDGKTFLSCIGPASLLLAAHYFWVVRSNVAFEEASVEASRKLADKVAAIRAGNWQAAQKNLKKKRDPFHLAPAGSQAVGLLWKNLISAGQVFFSPRLAIMLVVMLVALGMGVGPSLGRSGWGPVVAMLFGVLFTWSLMLGPQLLRQDLRQDLQLIDVLKCFPMRGWQVVLGELLAPVVLLTMIQWLLLWVGGALLFFSGIKNVPQAAIVALCLGTTILVPTTNFVLLLIPNTAVLLFPGWFHSKEPLQGIEATGQRLILVLGQVLSFLVALIPASLAFSAVFFALKFASGMLWGAVPPGAIAAALVMAGEGAVGVLLLGRVFEKFDLSDELRG